MTTTANRLYHALTLAWLTGPIFDKELRVSSRRHRSFVLRVVYILLLLAFVTVIYFVAIDDWTGRSASSAHAMSLMAKVGKFVTATVVGVQFFVLQLFAIIMCSTAISEERYRRTLGVLMTTPITSLQIVMGKLLSSTLQLFTLLAVSLPLLAVVRVFGGVPWQFLLAGVCVTATAMIFAASLSLLYSIFARHAYAVILLNLLTGGVLYMLVPFIVLFIARGPYGDPDEAVMSFMIHVNPLAVWSIVTAEMLFPVGQPPFFFSWQLHCLVMLAASAAVLAAAVGKVRKVALRQIVGGATAPTDPPSDTASPGVAAAALHALRSLGDVPFTVGLAASAPPSRPSDRTDHASGRIRPVSDSPVLWRELRLPLINSPRVKAILLPVLAALLVLLYLTHADGWRDNDLHMFMCSVYLIVGLITTGVVAATTATLEKEAGSWDILLACPMPARRIVVPKMLGAMRRSLLAWLPLLGHLLLFMIWRIHPLGVALVLLIALAGAVLVAGTGVLFSVIFRKTTAAVVANLGLWIGGWLVLPIILSMMPDSHHGSRRPELLAVSANPIVQTCAMLDNLAGKGIHDNVFWHESYDWPDRRGKADFGKSLRRVAWFNGLHLAGGALAVVLAGAVCRRRG